MASTADKVEAKFARVAKESKAKGGNYHFNAEQAEWWAGQAAFSRREAAYHAKMKGKYDYAAAHPWLPVEPDPPLPE
jgi:hypothetical protein